MDETPRGALVLRATRASWLRRHRVLITWLTVVLGALLAVGLATEIHQYRPLRLGSNTMDLDVNTIGDGIEQTRMVVPHEAGRSFSYATSVENNGSRAVVLTGAVVDTNPTGARPEVGLAGPDGRPSACANQICLASAAWAYGPFSHLSEQHADLTQEGSAWHPFGHVRLAPGASVMVRLTFLFNSCGQDNQGYVTLDGWTAKFDYFGQHTQFQPFRLPLTIKPLPAAQQHLPAACPKPAS